MKNFLRDVTPAQWIRLVMMIVTYQVPYWGTLWLVDYWSPEVQGGEAVARLLLAVVVGTAVCESWRRWDRRQDEIEANRSKVDT